MPVAHRLRHDRQLALIIGLALMAVTYLIFSARAMLDPISPGEMISLKRLIATGAGAGLFMLAVGRAARVSARSWAERLLAVLWVAAVGGLAILLLRIGYDLFVADRGDAVIARNARWMLAWLGYFAAAIGGYFTITMVKMAMRREKLAHRFSRNEIASALVEEVTDWSPQERRLLIARLSRIRDYEEVDPLVGCLDAPQD